MPDDERSRRRLGDETKGRIADLASGWTVDPEPAPAAPAPVSAPRPKARTLPPPPPGAAAPAAGAGAPTAPPRTKPPTAPPRTKPPTAPPRTKPPTAPPRTKPPTAPPPRSPVAPEHGVTIGNPSTTASGTIGHTGSVPVVRAAAASGAERMPLPLPAEVALPARTDVPAPPPARAARARAVELDDHALETIPDASMQIGDSKRVVPIGEFGAGSTKADQDKLRIAHAQMTIKRDAASALLGIPEQPPTVVKETPVELLLSEAAEHVRGDPTTTDAATVKFERGDPTALGRGDATATSAPMADVHTPAGRLRTVATLRRQRGLLGDVRYVRTALFGVRRARQELAALDDSQAARQQERRRHLVILGRAAVTSDGFAHPALGPAREQLAGIEDERARHRGEVAAADAELQRVTREREASAAQHARELAAVEAELVELARRLEPLHKRQLAATRRGSGLRDSMRRIDVKIAETQASLRSARPTKRDPVEVQAELATLEAERVAIERDEPKIAAELDALDPEIAAIEATRGEAQRRRAELVQGERDDQRRVEELLAAIGAKRKVMDRAAGDAETLRDKILFELGERLYVDRPAELAAQLAPIDSIDVELGTGERRGMELREILSSIDKRKLARGIGVIILALAALGAGASGLVSLFA